MRILPFPSPLMPPGISGRCIRTKTQHGGCTACGTACPTNGITFAARQPVLEAEKCLKCGDCLFTCPADAIDSLSPIERIYQGNTLFGQGNRFVPSVNELLMWYALRGIRQVSLDRGNTAWQSAVVALNCVLSRIGEPIWQIVHPDGEQVDHHRRRWLGRALDPARSSGSVPAGQRAVRDAFPGISWFQVSLDPAACVLCGACTRLCPEQAIMLTGDDLQIDPARCTGCLACEGVCFPRAVHVKPWAAPARLRRLPVTRCHCRNCRTPFVSFSADKTLCPLCRRHTHGMRALT